MGTLADEMKQCLSEMQAASDNMKKLMDTPGIVWPEVESDIPASNGIAPDIVELAPAEINGVCIGCYFWRWGCNHPDRHTTGGPGCDNDKIYKKKLS